MKKNLSLAILLLAVFTLAAQDNKEYTVNGVTFKMVYVEGGSFTMGCTKDQGLPEVRGGDCEADEQQHSVSVGSFWMGETEVTQALWQAVMGSTVREQRQKTTAEWPLRVEGEGPEYPIYYVSWDECMRFCEKLNSLLAGELPAGYRFALPTEAQWEYAARGGKNASPYKYSGSNNIDNVAWYVSNSDNGDVTSSLNYGSRSVKGQKPNALGLYDMSGNVWEWCADWYSADYYSVSPSENPKGPASGSERVLRGGSWGTHARHCRLSNRHHKAPDTRDGQFGFRLSLVRN